MTKLTLSALCLALLAASPAYAAPGHSSHQADARQRQPSPPRLWQRLPPSEEQARFRLQPRQASKKSLFTASSKRSLGVDAQACPGIPELSGLSGNALAARLAGLSDYTCTYGLFSLDKAQAATLYSAANLNAVAGRFAQEAAAYNAGNAALVNLALYLRAGYYLASGGTLPKLDANLRGVLRPGIRRLVDGEALFRANANAPSSAGEIMKLITNMEDEAYYLPSMRALTQRYTNSASRPDAARPLLETTASQGMTGVLTVFFYAHGRGDARALLQSDASYSRALFDFVQGNRAQLVGDNAYMLGDAAKESMRFLQYPALKPAVKQQARALLAGSSMTGANSEVWLAVADAVKYYDSAACADYGTCDYENRLADAVLANRHSCGPTLRIRAQNMTATQMAEACRIMQKEEDYFHRMLKTNRQPVANDNNAALEVVVFNDYANYAKYASAIYGIGTDNGGMYLEGDPAKAGNQARFIAHQADWLKPAFKIWNLEHEFVHYLDGRFNMYGDFGASTRQPTVWWIEGIGEYLSLGNDNQAAIDAAKSGNYRLSQIFGNTYGMSDYVTRAYRWGYMATRFMMERHRSEVDAMLGQFRKGDYDGYMNRIRAIGTRYDAEFAGWAQSATTAGQPPLPGGGAPTPKPEPEPKPQPPVPPKPVPPTGALPACPQASQGYLGKNCSLTGLSGSQARYAYINVPAGARNLRVWSQGGSGDADLYLASGRYPTTASHDRASARPGNAELLSVAQPAAGWHYILLNPRQPFSGLTLSASYD